MEERAEYLNDLRHGRVFVGEYLSHEAAQDLHEAAQARGITLCELLERLARNAKRDVCHE